MLPSVVELPDRLEVDWSAMIVIENPLIVDSLIVALTKQFSRSESKIMLPLTAVPSMFSAIFNVIEPL